MKASTSWAQKAFILEQGATGCDWDIVRKLGMSQVTYSTGSTTDCCRQRCGSRRSQRRRTAS